MAPVRRKRFGQHFLAPEWTRKVIDAVAPARDDVFVEIGPGAGALTQGLAAAAKQVVAVEIDRDLAADLAGRLPANVTLLTGDFLEMDLESLMREMAPARGIRVAGNLPYNISSPILFRLIDLYERTALLEDATVMLQREVADRITAVPGTRDYGVLTIMLRLHADAEIVLSLPPGAFRPPPKVRSAVVRLRFRPPAVAVPDPARLERLVKTLFSRRRKTLANALKPICPDPGASGGLLARAGIDPRRRPETLDLPELTALSALLGS